MKHHYPFFRILLLLLSNHTHVEYINQKMFLKKIKQMFSTNEQRVFQQMSQKFVSKSTKSLSTNQPINTYLQLAGVHQLRGKVHPRTDAGLVQRRQPHLGG